MGSLRTLMALVAGLAALAGCGEVGTTCPTSGSTEGCGDGLICTLAIVAEPDDEYPLPPLNVCLQQCETSLDCGDGEVCRVVCGTNDFKSCQTGRSPDFPTDICSRSGES